MKKLYILLFTSLLLVTLANAQTTAMDFTMNDCNGQRHNLFNELDSGNVVIMEFFMLSCTACIVAGDALEPMYNHLKKNCSSKIKFYHLGYTNSYTCPQITKWVNNNGYTSVPFDSGGIQTAYYGGMGMPTIAIAAGSLHKILFTSVGFAPNDTTTVADSIRAFFGCTSSSVQESLMNISSMHIFPNPVSDNSSISLYAKTQGVLELGLVNLQGQTLIDLGKIQISKGQNLIPISLINIPNGFYFLKGKINSNLLFEKISIIR